DIGTKERFLGYLNFLGIPWNFKFLWAPFLDMFSTKRRWLVAMQMAISALTMAVATACYLVPAGDDTSRYLTFIGVVFVGMAFLSATNDAAIDAYYLEGLKERREQAAYSGYRVLAYRIAMIFVRSGIVALVAAASSRMGSGSRFLPWVYGFGLSALTM